jgi:hypothetical protein
VSHSIEKQLGRIFIVVAIGMSLFFVLASSLPIKTRALGIIAGVGLLLLQVSSRRQMSKRKRCLEVVADEATLIVDGQACGEIFLGTGKAFMNPRLVLTTLGGKVTVEDIWHESTSLLAAPMSASHWHYGVEYPGVLSVLRPLKLLIRNDSYRPATVRARVYAKRS